MKEECEEGAEAGAEEGAAFVAETGGHALEVGEAWDVLDDIPEDTAAAIVLLEHRWAIPLRERIIDEGGIPIGESWSIRPTSSRSACRSPRSPSCRRQIDRCWLGP